VEYPALFEVGLKEGGQRVADSEKASESPKASQGEKESSDSHQEREKSNVLLEENEALDEEGAGGGETKEGWSDASTICDEPDDGQEPEGSIKPSGSVKSTNSVKKPFDDDRPCGNETPTTHNSRGAGSEMSAQSQQTMTTIVNNDYSGSTSTPYTEFRCHQQFFHYRVGANGEAETGLRAENHAEQPEITGGMMSWDGKRDIGGKNGK
jgi:hypothetical protein